ncbi:MAG: uracil-DNA glycosylase [Spirochaetales bacterium]|nr:uracil-DNA glycosylase [Spirochaetales bacterium]
MDQKKLYTDFWNLLSETEDYLKYGKKTRRDEAPVFTERPPEDLSPQNAAPAEEFIPDSEHCQSCPRGKDGKTAVPLMGSVRSDLWVITDPPGLEAEKLNKPLGHSEMEYFEKWMAAIEMSLPGDLCLQNLTRCRMPGNRPPFPDEINRCAREIVQRLEQHRPKALLVMGPATGAWFSGQKGKKVSEIRGQLYTWQGLPVVVTYSPDQVLNYGELKRPVWEDLKSLRNILNGS